MEELTLLLHRWLKVHGERELRRMVAEAAPTGDAQAWRLLHYVQARYELVCARLVRALTEFQGRRGHLPKVLSALLSDLKEAGALSTYQDLVDDVIMYVPEVQS